MNDRDVYDVTIIGGGPAGLYSAFYSGVREMKTKLIESQPKLGGKVQLYPEKMIWDVGGLPPTTGAQFIKQFVTQGLTFDPTVCLNTKVTSISKGKDGDEIFRVQTENGEVHLSKTLIVAVGGGIVTPQRLAVEGADRFELMNLHYTVQSFERFKDKTVLISGGGNAAIDWANELEPLAKKVYLTYRKEALKGHESQVTKLLNSKVTCFFESIILKLVASERDDMIEEVELKREKTGEIITIPVDEVVVNHGYERDTSFLKNEGLIIELEGDCSISGTSNSKSSVDGLYAAGDVLKHDGKLHLIAGAFQDAANAVNQAKQYIEPEASQFGMVSSHNERFKKRNQELKKIRL